MWLSPPPAFTSANLLISRIQNLWQSCQSLFFMLMGMLHLSTAGMLWLSALGRRLYVLPFASRMKSLLMKLEENVMLSGDDTQACLNQPFSLLLPNVRSYICLVHLTSLQGSGLVCCSFWKEKAWLLPSCTLHFMSSVGVGGVWLSSCRSAPL